MTDHEQRALIAIAFLAAHADGLQDPQERAAVQQLAQRFGDATIDVGAIERDVAGGQVALADAAAVLAAPPLAQLAYETAVGVAGADGARTPKEDAFLEQLGAALRLSSAQTQAFAAQAGAIVAAPLPGATPGSAPGARAAPDVAALDKRIVDAAVTNAALELLPESLASMAIIPLQLRLVWRIGQAYGYELDQGHIKDFVATLGVGLAGQYVEQFGRKLLGGLLGALGGGLGRAIGHQAASSGMTFATTWAIGQIAKQYYAGGRTLDADKLKAAFASLVEEAKALSTRYAGDIQQRAQTIDVRNLPALISQS
jgi:tellurite resistance protein/uncharacterized protein (DUF697 family)